MSFKIEYKDITEIETDALVNSTNHNMMGFSGVDSIIHSLGGAAFNEECLRHAGELRFGEAIYTSAGGDLKCKYVIHTYAPGYVNGFKGELALLRACYRESLKLADELECKTVAFPLIGAGAMGYPVAEALGIAISSINEYLSVTRSKLRVTLALFGVSQQEIDSYVKTDLDNYIKLFFPDDKKELPEFKNKESFASMLTRYIEERGLKFSQVYENIGIPKPTFYRMIDTFKDPNPKSSTVFCLAVYLRLSIDETETLLNAAGLAFSESNISDVIIRYFIENEIYSFDEINAQLVRYKLEPLYYHKEQRVSKTETKCKTS